MFLNFFIKARETGYVKEQRGGHAGTSALLQVTEIEYEILAMGEND